MGHHPLSLSLRSLALPLGRSVPWVVAMALSLSIAAVPARAQPRAYRDGVKAAEKGDWAATARLMKAAIAERSEERKRYTPYYHLGVALFEQGDCDGALAAWQESERQAALGKEEVAEVGRRRAVCGSRVEERTRLGAAERTASEALERATAAAASLRSAVASDLAGAWGQGSPSPGARQRDAEQRLDSTRQRIEKAKAEGDAEALAASADAAREVAIELDELREHSQRLRAEQGKRLGDQRARAGELVAEARRELDASRDLAPYPPQVRRKRADLESLVAEMDKSLATATDAYLQGAISRLSFSMQQLKEATADPPAVLSEAADAFVSGRYQTVLEKLSKFSSDSARARAHSLLLRSAAGYYLWVEQGESDQELLDRATADAAACARLDAKLRPAAALFSPRFVEFFAAALPSVASP